MKKFNFCYSEEAQANLEEIKKFGWYKNIRKAEIIEFKVNINN